MVCVLNEDELDEQQPSVRGPPDRLPENKGRAALKRKEEHAVRDAGGMRAPRVRGVRARGGEALRADGDGEAEAACDGRLQ
eukprot:7380653-Prymnesium_polylepis.1